MFMRRAAKKVSAAQLLSARVRECCAQSACARWQWCQRCRQVMVKSEVRGGAAEYSALAHARAGAWRYSPALNLIARL